VVAEIVEDIVIGGQRTSLKKLWTKVCPSGNCRVMVYSVRGRYTSRGTYNCPFASVKIIPVVGEMEPEIA
jgi:hypothetical protein